MRRPPRTTGWTTGERLLRRPCRYCFWAKGVTPAQMLRVNSALRDKSPAEAARDRVWQLSDHAGHVQRRESVGHNDPRDGTAWSSNS